MALSLVLGWQIGEVTARRFNDARPAQLVFMWGFFTAIVFWILLALTFVSPYSRYSTRLLTGILSTVILLLAALVRVTWPGLRQPKGGAAVATGALSCLAAITLAFVVFVMTRRYWL
jgi:hypothetical protein